MKPTVKESEKSRVLSTKEYSLFQFPDFKLSKNHLELIKNSITTKNLCKDHPIIVTPEDYRIISGRYRFLACYDLQLPIYYKIAEITTEKDEVRIKHIHKNISVEDVIEVYKDNEAYKMLVQLHQEFNNFFSLRNVCLCVDECRFKGKLRINRIIFDSGLLVIWDYKKAKNRLTRLKTFLDRYSTYGYDLDDAFYFMDEGPIEFNAYEDAALKKSMEYLVEYNKKSSNQNLGIIFNRQSLLDAYNDLEMLQPNRHDHSMENLLKYQSEWRNNYVFILQCAKHVGLITKDPLGMYTI